MSGLMKLACLVLVSMVVAGPITAKAAMTCATVNNKMTPCIGFLTQNAPLAGACCTGVSSLSGMAKTTPDRQQACRCLQAAAKLLGKSLNPGRAAGLPKACKVNIPYAISPGTDCTKVR